MSQYDNVVQLRNFPRLEKLDDIGVFYSSEVGEQVGRILGQIHEKGIFLYVERTKDKMKNNTCLKITTSKDYEIGNFSENEPRVTKLERELFENFDVTPEIFEAFPRIGEKTYGETYIPLIDEIRESLNLVHRTYGEIIVERETVIGTRIIDASSEIFSYDQFQLSHCPNIRKLKVRKL